MNLKNNIFSFLLIILLIIALFVQRSCNEKKINNLSNKEITIKYDTVFYPVEQPQKIKTIYKTLKGKEIIIPGKIDTIEVKTFEKSEDTTKLNMYINATRKREYTNIFETDTAKVTIYSETKGELLKIAPSVVIKNSKQNYFTLYGGVEVYNNKLFNNSGIKVDLGFQNKKGDILTAGYDNNKNIYLGYHVKIFSLKK